MRLPGTRAPIISSSGSPSTSLSAPGVAPGGLEDCGVLASLPPNWLEGVGAAASELSARSKREDMVGIRVVAGWLLVTGVCGDCKHAKTRSRCPNGEVRVGLGTHPTTTRGRSLVTYTTLAQIKRLGNISMYRSRSTYSKHNSSAVRFLRTSHSHRHTAPFLIFPRLTSTSM